MNKLIITALLTFFSSLALGQDSLNFTPPPTDYSVIFLGNLFGVVDGVLSANGSGNQILGAMFTVFNSAVLALGGIIIMYTLIVSTMNTAHEGQMLGQKWSSIWIPIRSIIGLGLLVPQASGYCLMQSFFMWVVIQGVGAADKVWDAALSYLNRGGVIIQANPTNPASALLSSTTAHITTGASTILIGQVCMLALEKQLEAQRKIYLDQTQNDKGPCANDSNNPLSTFCTSSIPDFLNSVNAVDVQNAGASNPYVLPMPNFPPSNTTFQPLNGICGTIKWVPINELSTDPSLSTSTSNGDIQNKLKNQLTDDEFKTAQLSRAIAIQQMYSDLSSIARVIVNNDPQIGAGPILPSPSTESPPPKFATAQFGVPLKDDGTKCAQYNDKCTTWGPSAPGKSVLFNGTEFLNAINDYNSVMQPTLNVIQRAQNGDTDKTNRDFIQKASASGWIMAGSYFYDLVKLNTAAQNAASESPSGLDQSVTWDLSFDKNTYLLAWFEKNKSTSVYPRLEQIKTLFTGDGDKAASLPALTGDQSITDLKIVDDNGTSSTVYGLINNSSMLQMPGQPGTAPLTFANTITFSTPASVYGAPPSSISAGCNWDKWWMPSCFDDMIANFFYKTFVYHLLGVIINVITQAVNTVLNALIWLPLQGIGLIYKQGVESLSAPGVNPIVALANMGVNYINFAGQWWVYMIMILFPISAYPPVVAVAMLSLPLILTLLGIMVSISFVTAYYIPVLPYIMFTFGALGWLMAVIEAMVAAPIVALGITHPEGHEAFGKGEGAIMILMNIFLRPAMMVIGFIAAIALTYVGVWLLNAGYDNAISSMQGGAAQGGTFTTAWDSTFEYSGKIQQGSGSGITNYISWAGLFAFFFSVITYTTLYLIIVQKCFTLISALPDKVLRWIGGQSEGVGQETAQWGEEVKSGTKDAGDKAYNAQQQMGKSAAAGAGQVGGAIASKMKKREGDIKAEGTTSEASANKPDDGGGAEGGAGGG